MSLQTNLNKISAGTTTKSVEEALRSPYKQIGHALRLSRKTLTLLLLFVLMKFLRFLRTRTLANAYILIICNSNFLLYLYRFTQRYKVKANGRIATPKLLSCIWSFDTTNAYSIGFSLECQSKEVVMYIVILKLHPQGIFNSNCAIFGVRHPVGFTEQLVC